MDQRQIFLRDVLTVLFKRKYLVAFFAIVVIAVVFVGNQLWPATYESVAKVRLIRGRTTSQTDPTVVQSSAGMIMVQMSREDVYSEIDLIYSEDVLRKVVQNLNLDDDIGKGATLAQLALGAFRQIEYALNLKKRPDPVQAAVETLEEAIEVEADDRKYVLEVSCRLGDPQLAHDVLANLIEEYKTKHLEVFAAKDSGKFFDEQVKRVGEELTTAQLALEKFRAEKQVVSVDAEEELLLTQYTDAKKLLVQLAKTETAVKATPGAQTEAMMTATLSQKTENTVVTELQLRLLELLLERNRITESLGVKHPQVTAINNEIVNAQKRLKEAVDTTRTLTEAKLADVSQRLQELNKLKGELEDLERNVRTKSTALEYYLQKREESTVADAMNVEGISSIREVESASLSQNPVSPRKLVNLVLAIIVGLVGGVALAFFLEYLDHGIKTPEDIEYYLKVPPLASFFKSRAEQLEPREAERLSTMIDALQAGRPNQCIEVTSAVGGEGANRVALALAAVRSENPEWRTLLVDFVGDGIQEIPSERGIADVLAGECDLADVTGSMGQLHVVGRGAGECPSYLWQSERMHKLLADIRQDYDRVVFHVAPVGASHDAMNLAGLADGVVVVLKADSTRHEVAARAIDMLRETKGQVVGAVLTDRKRIIPNMVYRRI